MKERWFTGFEDAVGADLSVGAFNIISDGSARTGDFHLSLYGPVAGIVQARRTLVNTYDCTSNGEVVIARQQVPFRVRMHHLALGQMFGFGVGTSVAPGHNISVGQTAAGTLQISGQYINTTSLGGFVPVLGKWYVARLHYQYQRTNPGLGSASCTLQIYDGDTMDDEDPLLVATATTSAATAMAGFGLTSLTTLGSNTTRAAIIDFDDWWISVASGGDASPVATPDLNWPRGSRIQAVPVVRQDSGTWAGSYQLVQDIPNSAIAGNEQTTSTPGASTNFQHKTAAELGLIPIGQLANDPTAPTGAPPFTGIAAPEGLNSGPSIYFRGTKDVSIPVPALQSFTLTAGSGQYNNGVWVRAFTIEWRGGDGGTGPGGAMVPFCSALSPATFLSATAAPNFAANIQIRFAASTPADRFLNPSSPGTSAYRRYGLGLIVTNGYNGRGLFNPFTGLNEPSSDTNTTDLQAFGGPNAIDAGPWTPIVALLAAVTPNGTSPPYANTNPSVRPNVVTFLLSSPRPTSTGSSGPTTTNLFGAILETPALVVDDDKPIAEAVKVTALLQRASGTGNDNILTGAAATSVFTNTAFGANLNSQFAIDWTERNAAEFDALTFGAQGGAGLGVQLRLGSIVMEVMTAGPCTKRTSGSGQYQQLCGTYIGNTTFQKIPLPFRASAIMVKKIGVGLIGSTPGAFKAWWMGGSESFGINVPSPPGTPPDSLGIMFIEDDGFWVGPSNLANADNSTTYVYLAIKDGQEDTLNDAYMVTGSFQRLSGSDPDVTVELNLPALFTASWIPTVVLTMAPTVLKSPDIASPDSDNFASSPLIATGITSISDKAFTTGNTFASGQYPYWAFRFDAAGLLATLFQYGTYMGAGGSQVIATNFRGEIIVVDLTTGGYNGRYRSDSGNSGSDSNPWVGGGVTTTDITAIANASFTVGATANVLNERAFWLAWKKDGSIGNTGNSDLPIDPTDPTDPPSDDICGGGGMKLPPGTVGESGCVKC